MEKKKNQYIYHDFPSGRMSLQITRYHFSMIWYLRFSTYLLRSNNRKTSQSCSRQEIYAKKISVPVNGNRPYCPFMTKSVITSRKCYVNYYYRRQFSKRCRCSIDKSSVDSVGKSTAKYSRLTSVIYERTDRRRIWIIWQYWWSNCRNTFSTYCNEILEQNMKENTIYALIFQRSQLRYMQTHINHKSSMQKESWKSNRQDITCIHFWHYFQWISESRLYRRYKIVIQDMTTEWIQSCLYRNMTNQDKMKILERFMSSDSKSWVIYINNPLEFLRAFEELL